MNSTITYFYEWNHYYSAVKDSWELRVVGNEAKTSSGSIEESFENISQFKGDIWMK